MSLSSFFALLFLISSLTAGQQTPPTSTSATICTASAPCTCSSSLPCGNNWEFITLPLSNATNPNSTFITPMSTGVPMSVDRNTGVLFIGDTDGSQEVMARFLMVDVNSGVTDLPQYATSSILPPLESLCFEADADNDLLYEIAVDAKTGNVWLVVQGATNTSIVFSMVVQTAQALGPLSSSGQPLFCGFDVIHSVGYLLAMTASYTEVVSINLNNGAVVRVSDKQNLYGACLSFDVDSITGVGFALSETFLFKFEFKPTTTITVSVELTRTSPIMTGTIDTVAAFYYVFVGSYGSTFEDLLLQFRLTSLTLVSSHVITPVASSSSFFASPLLIVDGTLGIGLLYLAGFPTQTPGVLQYQAFTFEASSGVIGMMSTPYLYYGASTANFGLTYNPSSFISYFLSGDSLGQQTLSACNSALSDTIFACAHGGQCIGTGNTARCSCPSPYLPPFCVLQNTTTQCDSQPCMNNGVCVPVAGVFVCNCPPGFTGLLCESTFVACLSSPCLNNGHCLEGAGVWSCQCMTGFSGVNCETSESDSCSSSPCLNEGTCISNGENSHGYTCQCPSDFIGSSCGFANCPVDACLNGGTCSIASGAYSCACALGYTGPQCSTSICASSPCQNNGICSPDATDGYLCTCVDGFTGLNCESSSNLCSATTCQHGGTCTNSETTYTCQCTNDYTGSNCGDLLNPCDNTVSPPCFNMGTCIFANHPGQFSCQCVAGFTGSTCAVIVNGCASNPCANDGSCTEEQAGAFLCQCGTGFTGLTCSQAINGCDPSPCQNSGTCLPEDLGAFICSCISGYTDFTCGTMIDNCGSSPCLNNALCNNHLNYFLCQCPPTFTGILCESIYDPCASNPCANNGSCTPTIASAPNDIPSFTCQCQQGFTGLICETNFDHCVSNQCEHNANCITTTNGYRCQCPGDYTGSFCETPFVYCDSNPCLNDAACLPESRCSCIDGFTGVVCQTNINDCVPGVCENGGACTDGINSYVCACRGDFAGPNCAVDLGSTGGLTKSAKIAIIAIVSVVVVGVLIIVTVILVQRRCRKQTYKFGQEWLITKDEVDRTSYRGRASSASSFNL